MFSLEPRPESAVMMATDMPAAISAYFPRVQNAQEACSCLQHSSGRLAWRRVNHRRASISLHSSLKLSAIHSFRPQERTSGTRWRPAGTYQVDEKPKEQRICSSLFFVIQAFSQVRFRVESVGGDASL